MKKTNKIVLISVLVSLLLLGIGYAAIQNITLSISGFAEVGAKAENFNVKFLEQVDINKNGFDSVIVDAQKTSDVTATINLSGLSKAGETISAIYTIKNESPDLSADLTVSTTNDAPEYLTISSQLEKTSLLAGEETTVEVVVKVTKTPITENIRAQIGVELIAMPVQPGEEGTSEGIKDFDQTPYPNGLNEFGYYYDKFYINEEEGLGFLSHADHSAEMFELFKVEEYPIFEKDEWFCTDYVEPGDKFIKDAFESGLATSINEGENIIFNGYELTLIDILPHGMYVSNKYSSKSDNGEVMELTGFNDGSLRMKSYDVDGNVLADGVMEKFATPTANGYVFLVAGDIFASFNVTGDLCAMSDYEMLFSLVEKHNYATQIIKENTCTEDGEIEYICEDCNDYYTLIMPAHNHRNDIDLNSICDDCGEDIEYSSFSFTLDGLGILAGIGWDNDPVNFVIPKYAYSSTNRGWYKIDGIYKDAFKDKTELRTIVIPDTVTYVRIGAFEGCYNLETVYFTGTQEQWEAINFTERNDYLINANIIYNYEIPTE